ncbi:MAG: stealth conserved region 3 domain-containing protein [Streptococcaceae bacterium]|jgi:hypothetical protein|nr:stealth conserved region 3 domain-containing protein [Streptococcaceae bacterium]
MTEKIDFIVTYLDGSDSKWLAEKRSYENEISDISRNSDSRYRNGIDFKFWMRSVEKYASWVNKIHIVTQGHLPEWLDITHPKLNIVTHKDYISAQFLPTFNSNVIELNFDRIEELAEQFVIFNDDTPLNAVTSPSDFFVNGLPKMQAFLMPPQAATRFDTAKYNNMAALNSVDFPKKLINRKLYSLRNGTLSVFANLYLTPLLRYVNRNIGFQADHLPMAVNKSTFHALSTLLEPVFRETSTNRFRTRNDINIWITQDYHRLLGKFIPRNSQKFGAYVYIDFNSKNAATLNSRAKVICIYESELPYEEWKIAHKQLTDLFEAKFSQKSSFEK